MVFPEKVDPSIVRLANNIIDELKQGLATHNASGFYVMLSPGPGEERAGGPGLSSLVSLQLCMEAAKEDDDPCPEKIQAVTFHLRGYNNSDWVDRAGLYVQNELGVTWDKVDITSLGENYAREMGGIGIPLSPSSAASELRSMVARRKSAQINFLNVSGYTAVQRTLYRVHQLLDFGMVAPVGNLDRMTTIELGKYLGVPDMFLYQTPSNGAEGKFEATRMHTRFFGDDSDGRPPLEQIEALDKMVYNCRVGRDVLFGVSGVDSGVGTRVLEAYNSLRGQTVVVMPKDMRSRPEKERLLFG